MATVTIDDSDDLLPAIQEYGEGDLIIVTDDNPDHNGVPDRTDLSPVDIPAGTHLDGEGVTIKTNERIRPLLRPAHPDIIIENIRFLGPKYEHILEHGWWDYETSGDAWLYGAEAISIYHSDVEVRHCEFSGWTHAAVKVGRNNGDPNLSPHIWGNAMVDNNCRALGYGVVVQGGDALIEWNYFQNNRHDVAGGDWEGVSYEVRYNHFGDTGRIYGTELHPPGGRRVHVHHNTFEDKRGNTPRKGYGRRVLIRNRDVPSQECLVENNWFKGEMTVKMSDESRRKYTFRNNHEGESEPEPGIGQPRPPDVRPGIKSGESVENPNLEPADPTPTQTISTRQTNRAGKAQAMEGVVTTADKLPNRRQRED